MKKNGLFIVMSAACQVIACATDGGGIETVPTVPPPAATPAPSANPAPSPAPVPPAANHCDSLVERARGWGAARETVMVQDYPYTIFTRPEAKFGEKPVLKVFRGVPATFEVEFLATRHCGEIEINNMLFSVYDESAAGNEWLKRVNDERFHVPGRLMETVSAERFPDFHASNMDVTPKGNELMYAWQDGHRDGYGAKFATQIVPVKGSKKFVFIFTATGFAPAGTTFRIRLSEFSWTDRTTGIRIPVDQPTWNPDDATLTVQVVE